MRKNILIIAWLLALTPFSSCKKALTEQVHSDLLATNFYQTAGDAEAALNGAFSQLQYQTYYQRTVYLITDLSADIFKPNNANADRQEFYHGKCNATNGLLGSWWSNIYQLIKNANDVITYVPKINMDITQKNDILGNAYFLRAWAHFDLVRTYGDVPIVLRNDGDQNLFPARSAANLVYEQVIKDLLFAEMNCLHADKLSSNKIGRITSEAASAMLAKVYLQRSGASYAVATDSQSALDECNKLIAYSNSHSGVLTLVPNYADIFNPAKKNGPECILSVQFGHPPNADNLTNQMFDPASVNGGFASFLPLTSFTGSFDPTDNRVATNVGTAAEGLYFAKYHDATVAAGYGTTNFIVLRYADVLLMQSESMNNINPADAQKFTGINAVRTRAGLGNLSLVNTPTSADFVNALVNERKWELAVEGHRRWDLIRLKKYISVKASQGFTVGDNDLVWPIPQTELDLNKNLVQNPGY